MPIDELGAVADRVPAGILFGDLKGSTEEAELDEQSSIAKLHEYERIINHAARRFGPNFYKLKTEGDGFMATFGTAHCMVECGVEVQQEFRRRGWHVRLGGHYGAVYRKQSGDIVGTHVNRAARIQSAADALRGEFLVSDVVQAIVRNRLRQIRFEPHTPIDAKGVAEALAVFEVVPVGTRSAEAGALATRPARVESSAQGPAPVSRPRQRWAIATAAVVAVCVAVAVLYSRGDLDRMRVGSSPPLRTAPADATDTIAVMEFENQRRDDLKNDWYSKALQTTFNTELSKIPQLSVIAPEIIQHAAREANLDRMAAARQLGVRRFVTGSFAVVGSSIRIDARVVETTNGLQETAENVEGIQDEFFSLQKTLALATLEHLRVRLTDAQQASFRQTTNSRLDKYRLLLEAEGVTASRPKPEEAPLHDPAADSLTPRDQVSWRIDLHLGGVAHAQSSPSSVEVAARGVLEDYRQAHERGDLNQLASLYVAFPDSQRQALDAYLKDVRELRVELVDVKIQPHGQDLAVSYTRRDNFVDKDTGEPVSLEVRVTKFLVQTGGTWKFSDAGQ
jgi:class 3 adenylate cyclase/TolB-like protein